MRCKTSCILAFATSFIAFGSPAQRWPLRADEASRSQVVNDTGSRLTAAEADDLVGFHNKARGEVGVRPVRWSPALAKFAQQWADEVGRTGALLHRPHEGPMRQRYGENMAWGVGDSAGVLAGAERWYAEIKVYEPGIAVPENIRDFQAAHYTQMVWKDTAEIGAGKAVIQTGDKQGWTVIVCNYNPPGNRAGRKPY